METGGRLPRLDTRRRNRAMSAGFRAFFQRHPVLRDVVLWSIPALAFGAGLRWLLMSYLPYGYWGSDSKSYYSFAHMFLSEGYISLDEKRRYLYPLLMAPVSLLPGAPLKWIAWLQHGFGLLAVLPLAYVVRKTLVFWRWWIVPVTVAYVGLPMFLWYEHELLAEVLFFGALAWSFGGWTAWVMEKDPARARRLFWWFFTPLAVFLLTKPSGRFVLPGIVVGLVMVRAWRVLDWRRWTALGVLFAVSLTVGSKKQAAWLLYVASFPLTQLETPKHAEYKAELRPIVEPYILDIDAYYARDDFPFDFLDSPSEEKAPPLWAALDKDANKKRALYMDLAMEGIKADPLGFLYLGAQRLVASANMAGFDDDRFEAGYYAGRFAGHYETARRAVAEGKKTSVPMAFGLPKNVPLPPYEEFRQQLSAPPGTFAESTVLGWVRGYERASNVVTMPKPPQDAPASAYSIARARPTVFGGWLMVSVLLALCYWRSLGVWMVIALGYLAGVFLVSLVNARYFAPAWLIFLPVLFVPLDLLLRLVFRRRT
jgi:hypothetical protein